MKTLLISGRNAAVPDALRDVITRGSTSVDEREPTDVDASVLLADVDRIVFWSSGDSAIRALATRCAGIERGDRRDAIVFITTDAAERVTGLSEAELFIWPRDEDRLMMAFMTGA